jgi:hypothetical protein
MLTTTIYDQSNATITGTYYTYKGECVTVEFMGSALECEYYMNGVYQANEGTNEVQHVTIHDKVKRVAPVATGFALHNAWGSVVQIQQ